MLTFSTRIAAIETNVQMAWQLAASPQPRKPLNLHSLSPPPRRKPLNLQTLVFCCLSAVDFPSRIPPPVGKHLLISWILMDFN